MEIKTLLILLILAPIFSYSQKTKIDRKYYKSGNIKSEVTYYVKATKKIREGKTKYWYETGELKNVFSFKKGEFHGERLSYWKNGKFKRKDFFKKGKLVEGKCFDDNGNEVNYYNLEVSPKYPGGMKALNDFLKEHILSSNKEVIQGILKIKFEITTEGEVNNVKILSDTNPTLREKALKMMKLMPHWSPAKQDGIPVKVTRVIPISFN